MFSIHSLFSYFFVLFSVHSYIIQIILINAAANTYYYYIIIYY